ncbi:unnamed protein product, partial [Choristocarpus tenellus]
MGRTDERRGDEEVNMSKGWGEHKGVGEEEEQRKEIVARRRREEMEQIWRDMGISNEGQEEKKGQGNEKEGRIEGESESNQLRALSKNVAELTKRIDHIMAVLGGGNQLSSPAQHGMSRLMGWDGRNTSGHGIASLSTLAQRMKEESMIPVWRKVNVRRYFVLLGYIPLFIQAGDDRATREELQRIVDNKVDVTEAVARQLGNLSAFNIKEYIPKGELGRPTNKGDYEMPSNFDSFVSAMRNICRYGERWRPGKRTAKVIEELEGARCKVRTFYGANKLTVIEHPKIVDLVYRAVGEDLESWVNQISTAADIIGNECIAPPPPEVCIP